LALALALWLVFLVDARVSASTSTATSTSAAPASPAPSTKALWQGEYSVTQDADAGNEASWASHLSVDDCDEASCRFLFGSGSMRSECAADGEFKFKSATRAEFTTDVKADDDESPRGQCVLIFERRKNGHVFVDAKNIFKSKADRRFGNPCNTLCGYQGARYFAVDIPKVSDKKFFNPSFSCVGATLSKIEKEICTNEGLAALDRDLAETVAKIKNEQPKEMAKLTTEQRSWLKTRDSKCAPLEAKMASCLETVYKDRSAALKKTAGASSPVESR
jgi:uncharacterized protein YecT (DUF1311 family)